MVRYPCQQNLYKHLLFYFYLALQLHEMNRSLKDHRQHMESKLRKELVSIARFLISSSAPC